LGTTAVNTSTAARPAARLTTALTVALVAAALVAAPGPASPAAGGIPRTCPAASVLKAKLRQNVTHVTSYAGPISSTTLAGMGPAPDAAHYKSTSQTERTCTYAGSATGRITISFVAPMTTKAFVRSRTSLRKSGVAVAVVKGVGDTAWAARTGGLLFVLKGSLDVIISAPRTSMADLKALANELV
jgi:carbohydrate-binding DOMON domain-containing protein